MNTEGTLTIIISALVGALVSYLGALIKNFLDRRTSLDENLRAHRKDVYSELWKLTGIFSLWPKNTDVNYSDLETTSNKLKDWYFEKGGIYLSEKARRSYGNVQKTLNDIIQLNVEKRNNKITESDYEILQKLCSKLRTELTRDLLSRKRYGI